MQVIKIGGSLYNTPELKKWLELLYKAAQYQHIIVVPGGGPYADTVRSTQTQSHFSEHHAHHMALLAMAQYGLLLHSFVTQSELFYFPSDEAITKQNGLSIWLPNEQLLTVKAIERSWSVTSDSLALWLAQQLNADQLCLIKRVRARASSIKDLSEAGIVDEKFADFYQQKPVESYIQYYQDFASFNLASKYPKRLSL